MKSLFSFYFICSILCLLLCNANAQQKIFNKAINDDKEHLHGFITSIAQDHEGYMWFGSSSEGLLQYDGSKVSYIKNNPQNTNSLASNYAECLFIDSLDIFWIGTFGSGLDRYDRANNKFTHFRHNIKNGASLINDTVTAILQDRSGNLWVGTYGGLDLYNAKNDTFTHYTTKPNDATSLSSNIIRVIYKDRQGTLWVGCGSPFPDAPESPEAGGLNRFDKHTGKFTRYLHDPANPNSIATNKVSAIYEDNKGNFWVGTRRGLHTLNRATGLFTQYYYDSTHPEKLSPPPIIRKDYIDFISFINEDTNGNIWIGSHGDGINQYNTGTKKTTHYGYAFVNNKWIADTASGFTDDRIWRAFSSKDGLLWISTFHGNVFATNPKRVIPYFKTKQRNVNTFYEEKNGSLWIGTDTGLIYKDITGREEIFLKNPADKHGLSNNIVTSIQPDNKGKLWLATLGGGINKFDPLTKTFTHYVHDAKRNRYSNRINNLLFDYNEDLWAATDSGLYRLNIKSGVFTAYTHDVNDSNSLSGNAIICLTEDRDYLWLGTSAGVERLNKKNGKFKNYPQKSNIRSLFVDKEGVLWAGAWIGPSLYGLYRYDKIIDSFIVYSASNGNLKIQNVGNVIGDNQNNLWVSAYDAIYKISGDRNSVTIYGNEYGVHIDSFGYANNYKTTSGKLFLGDQGGYYSFFPEQIKASDPPKIYITSFQLGDKEVLPGKGSALSEPLYKANKITLSYNQSSFSIGYGAIHYTSPGEEKYWYKLENYDTAWHDGASNKVYYFNLSPGDYIFHVKAMNSDGVWNEKKLSVIISPPWWQTWWAITLLAVGVIAIAWIFYYYRSRKLRKENQLLEEKVNNRTAQLQQSIEELKSTQAQLVQSEKMASLGELTAGIAHEIQNPLNFVNNFSEVNKELLIEMKDEMNKGNINDATTIADNLIENEEKINHHGKRADAIVKGMLQHSRTTSGQKEPADINALADEYLRLSYHGLRAKDKTFNATLQTDFDVSLGKINIIPQDIGRVLLNLYNNAFYAVAEKAKHQTNGYEPVISISTKRINDKVEIRVKDNGNGIPQNIVDKIFQPFFTTKPTGQGTGLGLSLSYDIIKAHSGEIKVETKEGDGSEFIIQLKDV